MQYSGWSDRCSYTQSGHVTKTRTQVKQGATYVAGGTITTACPILNSDATYSYDTEGKMTSVGYRLGGPTYTYSFDSMSRPAGLTNQSSNTIVSGLGYGPANEMLSMTYNGTTESRNYNTMLQLTSIASNGINMTYVYPGAGANNGKACLTIDNAVGEQVAYSYDSWGQSYTDGMYGKLTEKNVTAGSAPTMHVGVNPATNRILGTQYTYDANGNMTLGPNRGMGYDAENRMKQATPLPKGGYYHHAYDSQNKRGWAWDGNTDSNGWSRCCQMLPSTLPQDSIACDPVYGPNSNSAAAYLRHSAEFFPTRPPSAYGWDTLILVP